MGKGHLIELVLQDGLRSARLSCPPSLMPGPGQFVLAGDASDSPLPVPLFHTDFAASGFIAAPPVPHSWHPGQEVHLRGPLGRGFTLPMVARRVALVAYDDIPARLYGLIRPALTQNASVVVISNSVPENLPDEVEVQPLSMLSEVCEWSDYMALDVARANLPALRQHLTFPRQTSSSKGVHVLVRTPIACGGIAECGVCAVSRRFDWVLACKAGPVFEWKDMAG